MEKLGSTSRMFRALGHPARIRVVMMLHDRELCACQITAVLALAPSTVSAHLKELRRAGLVTERKEGRWVHYRLSPTRQARATVDFVNSRMRRDDQIASDQCLVDELRTIPPARLCAVDLDLAQLSISRATTRAERV